MNYVGLPQPPAGQTTASRVTSTAAPTTADTGATRHHSTARVPSRVGFWLTLAGIGVVGGVLSGLFAVGGGILMVPLLVWSTGMEQRRAAATSLVAILPPAVVGSLAYLVNGQVDAMAALFVALGAIVGAVLGTRLLRRVSAPRLRWMFVVFILLVAARLLLVEPHRGDPVDITVLVAVGYVGVGLIMGMSSGLFGIGGGIIAVPLMISLFAVSDLVAKGTSLLVSIPTSAVGTLSNRRAGLVDVRAGLVIGVAAAAASIPAVALSLALPARVSGQLFAGLLVLIAIHMSVKAGREPRTEGAGGTRGTGSANGPRLSRTVQPIGNSTTRVDDDIRQVDPGPTRATWESSRSFLRASDERRDEGAVADSSSACQVPPSPRRLPGDKTPVPTPGARAR